MDQDFVFIVQFWLAYSVSSIVNEWNLLFLIPENLLLSFIYTWIVCRGGERERGEKKIFVSCVKQTDEQRDPQRGCVMFGQPLLCVCSVFAWNSHDHQTPGYIHGGLHSILHTFWHQSSELYIFLILVNLYKYPRAFVMENVTVQYFFLALCFILLT